MKKHLIAGFLALLLIMPCIPTLGETEAWISFSVDAPEKNPMRLTFDEAWFSESTGAYQHALCQMSLGMSLAAFRGGSGQPDKEILRFFSVLGFSSPEVIQFDVTREDTIGTAMAWRYINCFDVPVPLVAIAISGGNYGDEWYSNFDIDDGEIHRGFLSAARQVADRAREYLSRQGLTDAPIRFWISGYSRGAAVSNLTAALLAEERIGGASDDTVYAYTFATPGTVRGDLIGRHPNIYNIVNPNDLIPMTPPASWGYGRYGHTLYLPTSADTNNDYAALLPAFSSMLLSLSGSADENGDADIAGLAQAVARGMANAIPSPALFTDLHKSLLVKVITGKKPNLAESALGVMLVSNILQSVNAWKGQETSPLLLLDFDQAKASLSFLSTVLYQHHSAYYAAWLLSLPDGQALLQNSLTLTESPSI
ncbi:MAG: hypothetical protein IKP32_00420 [Clostridia bacterium]|nr:hypothetical protein [Clostridia bacterium]